jgi:hypothetical protein
LAIDPGVSTGVAWGIFNDRAPTALHAARDGLLRGSLTITGGEMVQARELFVVWRRFKEQCVRRNMLEPEWIDLVIEDFTLFPGAHAGGKEGIAPVRIGWAFEGYRQGRSDKWAREKHVTPAVWQSASVGMANRRLLKRAGMWVPGKEHERAAYCHIIARLKKVLR